MTDDNVQQQNHSMDGTNAETCPPSNAYDMIAYPGANKAGELSVNDNVYEHSEFFDILHSHFSTVDDEQTRLLY